MVTGNSGINNAEGIRRTAVAAGASVDHRICVSFDYSAHDPVTPLAFMPGGFIVFARRENLIDQVSQLPLDRVNQLGVDIIALVEFEQPTWQTGEGNPHVPSF